MKDYEILHIPNSQLPNIGLLHLTVSENRVGLRMTVLDTLGRPDGIIIRRGIKRMKESWLLKPPSMTRTITMTG